METPELEFLQYMLKRYIALRSIEVSRATVVELLDAIEEDLTPIGGG